MKILIVTNLYPTEKRPFISPFVKEQVDSMRRLYPELQIDVRIVEGERPRWPYVREMMLLPFVVSKGRYDIVHAHFGLTLVSMLFVRAPVIVTFHGSDLLVSPTKHISRFLAPLASRVIVVAERLKRSLGYGEVIPCGIAVERFALPTSRENKQSPKLPGKLKVLFPSDPARIIKDYALFEAVCDELTRRGNEIEVVHLINMSRSEVRKVYWDCDVLLLTSISEGSPTVIKEAIAAKLPFVSTDVGDVREWAALVEFGSVVSSRKSEEIADSVISLLGNISCRSSLDNANCLSDIDVSHISKKLKAVYDEVIRSSVDYG